MAEGRAQAQLLKAYWRSLRQFPENSTLLAEAEEEAFFQDLDFPSGDKASASRISPESSLVFILHHKCGENLANNVANVLRPGSRRNWAELGALPNRTRLAPGGLAASLDYFVQRDRRSIHFVFEPSAAWPLPEGARAVHFVRDPVDLILSAYRYHRHRFGTELWSWGKPGQCFMCDERDHERLFAACGGSCSYFALLNRVSARTGALLEAVSMRRVLWSMIGNLQRWAENPNVLHFSVDQVRSDYKQAARCLADFLNVSNQSLVDDLAGAVHNVYDESHVTAGKYNNTELRAFLEGHAVWGPTFRSARAVLVEAHARHARLHGCPLPA